MPDSAISDQDVARTAAPGLDAGGQEAKFNAVISPPRAPYQPEYRRTMTARRGSCVICRGRQRSRINGLLADGWSANAIETEMRRRGHPVKRETVARHRRRCLDDDPQTQVNLADLERRLDDGTPASDAAFRRDLAVLVQQRAIRALERGAIGVTTADGLKAQGLLDRRVARQQDQAFVLNLARLLSGGGKMAPRELMDDDD